MQVASLIYPETVAKEQSLIADLTGAFRNTTTAVRRVTVFCNRIGRAPKYYTFRKSLSFGEDTILRHIEPASSHLLEIRKLENYDIVLHPVDTPDIHLYYAVERNRKVDPHQCIFVRAMVKHRVLEPSDVVAAAASTSTRARSGSLNTPVFEVLVSEVENILSKSLEAIDVAASDNKLKAAHGHHVFLNIIPPVVANQQHIESVVLQVGSRHGSKLWRLKVRRLEVLVNLMPSPNAPAVPIRFFISNPSGHFYRVHIYKQNTEGRGRVIYRALPGSFGRGLDGMPPPFFFVLTIEKYLIP